MIPANFKGLAKPLDAWDYCRLAQLIGCVEDVIRAVVEVETAGGGFDAQGRPKMLFEPHVFWARLDAPQRQEAAKQGLAYRRWGEVPYPRDSYPRLELAMKINRAAALESASWGLGQIMGFNCHLAGYATAEDMVLDFLDDEENHLRAMVAFIKAAGLDDALRRLDWPSFALGYNGPAYARHGYHIKLRTAHNKWRQRPNTPQPKG